MFAHDCVRNSVVHNGILIINLTSCWKLFFYVLGKFSQGYGDLTDSAGCGGGYHLSHRYCTRAAAEVILTKRIEQFFRPALFWNQVDVWVYDAHTDLAKTLAHWRVEVGRMI